MSVQNFTEIHPNVLEIFQSGLVVDRQTNNCVPGKKKKKGNKKVVRVMFMDQSGSELLVTK